MEDIRTETLWKLYGNFMLWKFMETIRTETLLKIYANFMLWKLHLDYTDGNFIETLWNFKFSYLQNISVLERKPDLCTRQQGVFARVVAVQGTYVELKQLLVAIKYFVSLTIFSSLPFSIYTLSLTAETLYSPFVLVPGMSFSKKGLTTL